MTDLALTPEQPKFGSPCNGCGACCIAVPCPVAEDVLGATEGPCPALEYDEGRYWCGLLRNAHKHLPGLSEKPWADAVIRQVLMSSGAWDGTCDSGYTPERGLP